MSTPALAATRSVSSDYLELTKPRITLMVVLTTLVGFVMGNVGPISAAALIPALVGTALVAAGASVLNMVLERRIDAMMLRTRNRPLPSGRLGVSEAVSWGVALTASGLVVLTWLSGPLAGAVAAVTWGSYVFIYTPLKTRTSLATIVGAFPGALPPVIGWVAARGVLEPGTFVLFAILFLWQIPHFLAIASLYREDYARAGLPMLPVLDPEGRVTGRQALANSIALMLVSLTPTAGGMAGRAYLVGALSLGVGFTALAAVSAVVRTKSASRRLFLGSLVYLAALSTLLLIDRV
jgi:heme o synthase